MLTRFPLPLQNNLFLLFFNERGHAHQVMTAQVHQPIRRNPQSLTDFSQILGRGCPPVGFVVLQCPVGNPRLLSESLDIPTRALTGLSYALF